MRSQVEGRGVVVEAQDTLTTAGLQTRSGDLGTRFQAGQILQHGTYNNQAIEHWGKKKGGWFGGGKTTYNLSRTSTAIPDTNASTGSVQLTSRAVPLALFGTEFWVPEGQLVELHSVPGAQLRALYSIRETISRCQSSSLVRSVMRGSHALTRIPRPVIAHGGGRLHYVPLPLPMGETSDRPALTVETFVRPENNQLSSLVVAKSALPGLEEIVAQYPGQVAITPVSLTHHESHYKVVTLSPLLGVSVGIAVACLTHGAGASLLSVTGSTSTFFANSVFSAVVGNLANGVASQAVGDPRGLSRAFNEDAVKGMAVSIIGQYIGEQVAEGLGVAGEASLKNMSDLLGRVAIDTTVQTTLRTVVMQEELNKAFAGALRSSAAQQIGRAGATDIGAARAAGGLGYLPHKLLHGLTGALTGALLNRDDPAAGAAAGGFGASVAEVIGEAMAPDLEQQATEINKLVKEKEAALDHPLSDAESRKIRQEAFTEYNDTLTHNIQFKSRLLTVAASAIADVDPKISDVVAQNAVENNLVQLLVVAGFAAWAIYDTYTVYDEAIKAGKPQEEAALDAMIHLGFEVVIGVVGGKVIASGAKIAASSIKAAWQHVMHINPGLKLFMQKMGMNVALAAETVGGKITRLDQAADAFLTRHWTKATGRAATGEAAGATGRTPFSLDGLSSSEQQIAEILNQQLTIMPEMAGFMTDTTLNRVVKDIGLKPGQTYQASYLRNQTLGWIAEQRGMKVLERAGYQVVESKLPGNKGFDAVGIRHTAAGDIQDIMIVESKFSADGAVKLARYKGGRGGHYQQMSDEWIRSVSQRMQQSGKPNLERLANLIDANESLVTRKLNVLTAKGDVMWKSDKLSKTEIYKS